MSYFIEQLRLQFQQFYKYKLSFYIYIAIHVITITGFAFFICNKVNTVFLISNVYGQFGYFLVAAFLITAFLYFIRYLSIHETILSINKNKNEYLKYAFILFIILLFLYNIEIFILLFINIFRNDGSTYFLQYLPVTFLMNIFLPQFCSLCIVLLLSMLAKHYVSYILLLVFLVITSPYGESFVFTKEPTIPLDTIYYYLRLPFSFFMQNTSVSVDYLYGFQNEQFKLFIFLFWILLTITIILIKRQKKYRKILISILSCITIVSLCMSYLPQSMLRPNRQWNKDNYDYTYYVTHKNDEIKHEDVQYMITKYKMNYTITNQLYAKGTIHLESQNKQKDFVLTLYQKYKIEKLESKNEIRSYKQEGDYIYITFKDNIKSADISIAYKGYHDRLYSNHQAVLLPGYFAWYPMAGKKILYSDFNAQRIALYGYNATNKIEPAYFDIQVNSQCDIITNLSKESNHHYTGISDGLTMIGGTTKKTKNDLFINYYPGELYIDYQYDEMIKEWQDTYDKTISQLKNVYFLDTDFLENKKIIVLPSKLTYSVTFGEISIFDDYILITSDHICDIQSIFRYLIIKDDHLTLLKELFMLSFDRESPKEFLNEFENSVLAEESPSLLKKFSQLHKKIGDEKMMKELVQYVIGNHSYKDDESFIEGVRSKYVKNQ